MKEYKGTEKPKLLLRANYPVDYYKTGPLVRMWCMNFEGVLLFLKEIAANSNYKNVVERMVAIWAMRTGLALYHDFLSEAHTTELKFLGEPMTVRCDDGKLTVLDEEVAEQPRLFDIAVCQHDFYPPHSSITSDVTCHITLPATSQPRYSRVTGHVHR